MRYKVFNKGNQKIKPFFHHVYLRTIVTGCVKTKHLTNRCFQPYYTNKSRNTLSIRTCNKVQKSIGRSTKKTARVRCRGTGPSSQLLTRLRLEDPKCENSQSNSVRLCLKIKKSGGVAPCRPFAQNAPGPGLNPSTTINNQMEKDDLKYFQRENSSEFSAL